MHEMSIAESLLQLLLQQAQVQQFRRVRTIWLEVGPLVQVESEALRFCFDAVTHATLAEGARLEIIEPAGQAWCPDCAQQVAVNRRYDPCPRCGSYQWRLTQGDELKVKELEVE